MTKKHFQALADALRATKPMKCEKCASTVHWQSLTAAIANLCASQNPRFDRTRFLKACGVED